MRMVLVTVRASVERVRTMRLALSFLPRKKNYAVCKEVESMAKDYEKMYKELVQVIDDLMEMEEHCYKTNKEPEWPDQIDDRKKVIQFRNAVHLNGFILGACTALNVLKLRIKNIEED